VQSWCIRRRLASNRINRKSSSQSSNESSLSQSNQAISLYRSGQVVISQIRRMSSKLQIVLLAALRRCHRTQPTSSNLSLGISRLACRLEPRWLAAQMIRYRKMLNKSCLAPSIIPIRWWRQRRIMISTQQQSRSFHAILWTQKVNQILHRLLSSLKPWKNYHQAGISLYQKRTRK